MEKSVASGFNEINRNPQECWEVYQKVLEETKTLEDYLDEECNPRSYDEGEEETEWLKAAGLGELAKPWKEGREVQAEELSEALHSLSCVQAEAVKRRVQSLNHTVKQHYNQRQKIRKPNIRDFFKDSEVVFRLNGYPAEKIHKEIRAGARTEIRTGIRTGSGTES